MIDDLMTDEKASDFTLNQKWLSRQGGHVRELLGSISHCVCVQGHLSFNPNDDLSRVKGLKCDYVLRVCVCRGVLATQ